MVRDRQIFHAELKTEMGAGALFTSLIKHLPDLELLAEFDLLSLKSSQGSSRSRLWILDQQGGNESIAIGFFSQPTLISQAHCQKTCARGRSKEMMQTVNKCDESVKCVQLRSLIGSRRRMRKRSRLGACSRAVRGWSRLRLCKLVSGRERHHRPIELQQQMRMSTTMKMDLRSCANYQLTMIHKSTNLKWLWRQIIGHFEPDNTRCAPL